MYIKNVKVYGPDRIFREGGIGITGDVFSEAVAGNAGEKDIYDGKGCYAIPGLIDIHFHGALGEDVCDGTFGRYYGCLPGYADTERGGSE